ncbi:MAG: fused response regulator/phosphatase [Gammaproteobacteria bacterium]|nr:fused response regulator/phosphatase [Gammaproteobacteria bacterium]
MADSLKVLVVDDDRTNVAVLRAVLMRYQYQVVEAGNGFEAIEKFTSERPDMVLMDVMMPGMNGYDATRRIKKLAGSNFVPVIFLTAVTEDEALAECVRCGGDDFITKPYNHIILKSKIDAMVRIKEMTKTIVMQNRELSYHHDRLRQEQEIAKRIFTNIVTTGYRKISGMKYYLSPMSVFNGDLFLYAIRPTGSLNVLIGDFTGHGLSAAVGAVPVSDLFYAMTSNGFSVKDIVSAINSKLNDILPKDLFFAAVVMEVDSVEQTVTVWNGGMPDVLLCDANGVVKNRGSSRYVPMGILAPEKFDRTPQVFEISAKNKVYIYSDGATELTGINGVMLGQEGLEQMVHQAHGMENTHDAIINLLKEYSQGKPQADDITFVELTVDRQSLSSDATPQSEFSGKVSPMEWSLDFKLEKALLTRFDPLPFLSKSIMDMQGLYSHREKIHTILAELVNNAVEHGILELDSEERDTPSGFRNYFESREKLLVNAQNGWLRISIQHANNSGRGCLKIKVSDSGRGFDYGAIDYDLQRNKKYRGRGIPLVRALSKDLEYSDNGSSVTAVYEWGPEPDGGGTSEHG